MLTENSSHPVAATVLAHLRSEDRRFDEAEIVLAAADFDRLQSLDQLHATAIQLFQAGRLEQAHELWARARAADPNWFAPLFGLVCTEVRRGRYATAARLTEAVARHADDRGRSILLVDALINSGGTAGGEPAGDEDARARFRGLRSDVVDAAPDSTAVSALDLARKTVPRLRADASADLQSTKLSLICPIHRPYDLDNAVRHVTRQSWPNAEAIVALHTTEITAREITDRWRSPTPLRVLDCSSCATIGAVLNKAISASAGDVILKFDADDLYMPEYASDMMRSLDHFGADVAGKRAKFVLFDANGTLLLENPDWSHRPAAPGDICSGSAICARREVFERIEFQDTFKTAEDLVFLRQCIAAGSNVIFADPFNHVLMRSPDPTHHSWSLDDLMMPFMSASSTLIGDEADLSPVEI